MSVINEGGVALRRSLSRNSFEQYVNAGLDWLAEELRVAQPKVILTLGAEVAGILQGVRGQKKRNTLLGGDAKPMSIGGREYPVIHLAHPGITMRKASDRNPWPRLHREEHIPVAKKNIMEMLR
ncbi:MAG: uracil-DNA glycosylase family protein [Candidatus Promineifilaceae bacterium]